MLDHLRISVAFLDSQDPQFHGRADRKEPEWPPSPLRLMQAIVAANSNQLKPGDGLVEALKWLESQTPPLIVAPPAKETHPFNLSVPNNSMDFVAEKAWSVEKYYGFSENDKGNPAKHRTIKEDRAVRMLGSSTVHYLWRLNNGEKAPIEPLMSAAKRLFALGWGIDLVVGNGDCISSSEIQRLSGELWKPVQSGSTATLRTPVPGTLHALQGRHEAFLGRIDKNVFNPVPPLTRFKVSGYRRPTDSIGKPFAVFELRNEDDSFCRYPQRKLIHIAGMTRHLTKELMLHSPPAKVDDAWVERYVAGHRDHTREERETHEQFSYLPLPSIGHEYADQAIRRIMIIASQGKDQWLDHAADLLDGRQLKPENGDEFGKKGPPALIRVRRVDCDGVSQCYTRKANKWASVTPIILPGHDDGKPDKRKKLIEVALAQSGIEQPCTFEWSTYSRFRNSLSAYKTGRNKRANFFLPPYLQNFSAIHLTLTFDEGIEVPGPIAIGAGRHCGFGIMAAV